MSTRWLLHTTLAVTCYGATVLAWADVIYVDDDAPAGGDGLSWTTPLAYLQDALTYARDHPEVVEIRVAGGTYRPDRDASHPAGTGDRATTFQLATGLALRGGYAGLLDPNNPDARDVALYETILSPRSGRR